ncbi:MAG: hypothetical protein CO098_08655 [Bacteroidetes bacterium CG_4_9_14_3_um_filter_41_19]|nr:MAG: hypothetical protein CO098_08655 [Bacteroidetes bacterium CG_4_9_14_3_um_filter_41_19]
MNIGFANNTGYKMKVELFPKTEYLQGEVFYKGSAFGGGYKYKEFSIETAFNPTNSFKYILYTTNDTLLNPNQLLANIFDSIYITLSDSLNIKIVLKPDTSINMNTNPFKDTSVWTNKWIYSSTPNSDCENKSETKMCKFYFETEYLTGINQSPSI